MSLLGHLGLLVPPPDKQDMLLAFGLETARAIVLATGPARPAEVAKVEERFPRATLEKRGLFDAGGPTARFGHAYNLSLAKLKSALSEQEKLELAETFFDICRADADVQAAEVQVVVLAMQALGVSKARLAEYMRSRLAVPHE